jgi:hypothetical protein
VVEVSVMDVPVVLEAVVEDEDVLVVTLEVSLRDEPDNVIVDDLVVDDRLVLEVLVVSVTEVPEVSEVDEEMDLDVSDVAVTVVIVNVPDAVVTDVVVSVEDTVVVEL